MTIEEIKQKRFVLREQLDRLINDFELLTGCEVHDIELERMPPTLSNDRGRVIVSLQVALP